MKAMIIPRDHSSQEALRANAPTFLQSWAAPSPFRQGFSRSRQPFARAAVLGPPSCSSSRHSPLTEEVCAELKVCVNKPSTSLLPSCGDGRTLSPLWRGLSPPSRPLARAASLVPAPPGSGARLLLNQPYAGPGRTAASAERPTADQNVRFSHEF
jgi:hypothetical protein